MTILIKNGTVVNPADQTIQQADLYIENGIIKEIGADLDYESDDSIDARGSYVMPGFIDLHVHFRDPGLTHKETIETGSAAAAHGGFTTVVAMPNTKPVADTPAVIKYVTETAASVTDVHVLQVGAITKNQAGKEISDIIGMVGANIPAISEDGKSVMDSGLYREAMELAAGLGIPVLAHCEDINMVKGGVMNADERAKELGLPGITNSVEDVIVARDIILAKETGAHLHLCHCSTKDSVRMVELAKEAGIRVSAEVCPHHFCLTSEDIQPDDTNYKMNPPLRTKEDVEALKEGLRADIMDVIATDHAPHTAEEKQVSMQSAPFGIVGLETAAALTYTELVKPGILTIMQMAEKMSYNPARILSLDKGFLNEGAPADIVVFNPEREYKIDPAEFLSKGKNTPFAGKNVFGKVTATIIDGKIAYKEGETN